MAMRISLGADHAGFELKEKVKHLIEELGHEVKDEGTVDNNSVDYPDYAKKVAEQVAAHKADRGVLVCGSGIGMAIAANKVPGIRAASINNVEEAKLSREHNNLNVLTLGARLTNEEVVYDIVETFLNTPFAGGRHEKRVEKISQLEKEMGSR